MNSRLQTPRDKYMNDPEYHRLVDAMESFIDRAQFTPSELREAAMLASINYEMRHIRDRVIDPKSENAMRILDEWTTRSTRK